MLRRVSWFVGGAAAGVAGATVAKRRVKKTAAALPPVRAARQAVAGVKSAGDRVGGAVRAGRDAMRDTEARLWAKRNGDVVAPIEVIDGRIVATGEVKPGQVIVLREVAEQRANRAAGSQPSVAKRARRSSARRA
jgi:hypothetical protein